MLQKQKNLTFLRAVFLSAALPNAKPGGGREDGFKSAQRVMRETLSSELQREYTVHGVVYKRCFQLKPNVNVVSVIIKLHKVFDVIPFNIKVLEQTVIRG